MLSNAGVYVTNIFELVLAPDFSKVDYCSKRDGDLSCCQAKNRDNPLDGI